MIVSRLHQPPHALGVDGMPMPLQLLGDAPIAVRRTLAGHLDKGVPKRPVLVRPGLVVGAAASQAQDLAEPTDRIVFTQQRHYISFLVANEPSLLQAFCSRV